MTPIIDCSVIYSNCLGVFQGGGCKAIAYVGAYKAALEAGISFGEVAGTSAGAIFAALIAAGATPEQLKSIAKSAELKAIPKKCQEGEDLKWIYKVGLWYVKLPLLLLNRLNKNKWKSIERKIKNNNLSVKELDKLDEDLNNAKTLLKLGQIAKSKDTWQSVIDQFGIYNSTNIDYAVSKWLFKLTGKWDLTFKDLKLPLSVYASDVRNNRYCKWSSFDTPDYPVAKAVAASCSIPFYFTPQRDNDQLYVDGCIIINRPDLISKSKPNYFQTLSFKLESSKNECKNLKEYLESLVDTVICGADSLQHESNGVDEETFGIQRVNEVSIPIGNISATEFSDLDEETIVSLFEKGETAMQEFINEQNEQLKNADNYKYAVTPRRILKTYEHVYNQVAFWSNKSYDTIIVSMKNFDWVWPLFSTVMSWRMNGVTVNVHYEKSTATESDETQQAKRRILESLGCNIMEAVAPEIFLQGFFFKDKEDFKCIMCKDLTDEEKQKPENDDGVIAKVYNDEVDAEFINRILGLFKVDHDAKHCIGNISIEKVDDPKQICDILKSNVPQYAHADIVCKSIPISKLRFMKNNIRNLKFKELRLIDALYQEAGIELYEPAQLEFPDGKISKMSPIVLEDRGDDTFVVIKGNARCLNLFRKNTKKVYGAVVKSADPLPDPIALFRIDDIRLSEYKDRGSVKLDKSKYRQIDQAFRPNSTYLK